MPAADFGTLLVETDIDRLVIDQLREWLPTYLAHAEEERGLRAHLLARPKRQSFQNALEDDEFPDAQLPAVIVTTAQTEGQPEGGPMAGYSAVWRVNVSIVVRGRTPAEVREVAAVFGGQVRAVLVHQQIDLDGEVRWTGSLIQPVPSSGDDKGRWLAAAMNSFLVYTDVALSGDGPVIPTEGDPPYDPPDPTNPDEPYDPLAQVGEVTTTITAR